MFKPLVFGSDSTGRVVAAELVQSGGDGQKIALFVRDRSGLRIVEQVFNPFAYLADDSLLSRCGTKPLDTCRLGGDGEYRFKACFGNWDSFLDFKKRFVAELKKTRGPQDAHAFFINDPVEQFLIASGATLFKDLGFHDLSRVQVDIETNTKEGFEFCNADREEDRILAIGIGCPDGGFEALLESDGGEKKMLQRFVELVREIDPDIVEGHNIFNFDLPYISRRAAMHGVRLALGRDGSLMADRPSQFSAGDRTVSFKRFSMYGRHIVDTMFMARLYDVSLRSIESFSLKNLAVFFGISPENRTYIEGSGIAPMFRDDPGKALAYLKDDITETRGLSDLLSPVYFAQASMLPLSYQNVCVRGNGSKIDALMLREYFRSDYAVPRPGAPRKFAGGYTDIFVEGVVKNVHHCDVRSLYPSLMLSKKIAPSGDALGAFLPLLEFLLEYRLDAKRKMSAAATEHDRNRFDSMQSAFKILINSFYGYLGFAQGHFNDFDAAERVASEGRSLLGQMVEWLREAGAVPVEIDTDGIYFVPPDHVKRADIDKFRDAFRKSLPDGIEIEFDGEYSAMYSYKMKNYALLDNAGKMTVKGAALKSRGMEPYLRKATREILDLMLRGKKDELQALKQRYSDLISGRRIDIAELAKTESLREAPSAYAEKTAKGGRGKNAAYELALKSDRNYRAGDQVSYYIAGTGKRVTAHSSARLVSDFDPANRDENTDYYLAKLEALFKKF